MQVADDESVPNVEQFQKTMPQGTLDLAKANLVVAVGNVDSPGHHVHVETVEQARALIKDLNSRPDMPKVAMLFPDSGYEDVSNTLHEYLSVYQYRTDMFRHTIKARVRLQVRNFVCNLARARDRETLTLDRSAPCQGPAVIVASGPSLAAILKHAEEINDRAQVFVCNTASRAWPMNHPNVRMVSLESKDTSSTFADVKNSAIMDMSCHPNMVQRTARAPIYVAHAQHGWALHCADIGVPLIPSGGSVATVATAIAARLGFDPIILVGVDLGYTQGRAYAAETAHGPIEVTVEDGVASFGEGGRKISRRPVRRAKGWGDGQPVWSSTEFDSFRSWFEKAAPSMRGSGRRLINATGGGAHIGGWEDLEWEKAAEALAAAQLTTLRVRPLDTARAIRDVERYSDALTKNLIPWFRGEKTPARARVIMMQLIASPMLDMYTAAKKLEMQSASGGTPLERADEFFAGVMDGCTEFKVALRGLL